MTTSVSQRRLVGLLGGLVVAEVVVALSYAGLVGWGWRELVDNFVVTNGLMALTFGLCGAVIAWHRPANPIGWLFLADGLGHATTPLAETLAVYVADHGGSIPVQRAPLTPSLVAPPRAFGPFLPPAPLLFPPGRAPSPPLGPGADREI